MCLQKFVENGKVCNWPGCNGKAVTVKFNVAGKTTHCLKHQLRKLSGRVGPNWKRDHYRENLKPQCELSNKTWCNMYKEVKAMFEAYGLNPTRRELVMRTCQQFDVDHIDGNHYNNDPSNLQTLTKQAHKFKTDVMGDAIPTRYRNAK